MAWVAAAAAVTSAFAQGESNAEASEYNAAVARQNAQIATEQGVAAVQAQQRSAFQQIGAARAAYGASGVQSDSGSASDILAQSAAMSTLDKLTTQYNYQIKALGYTNQAQMDDYAASSYRTSAILNAAAAGTKNYAIANSPGLQIPTFGSGRWDASSSQA